MKVFSRDIAVSSQQSAFPEDLKMSANGRGESTCCVIISTTVNHLWYSDPLTYSPKFIPCEMCFFRSCQIFKGRKGDPWDFIQDYCKRLPRSWVNSTLLKEKRRDILNILNNFKGKIAEGIRGKSVTAIRPTVFANCTLSKLGPYPPTEAERLEPYLFLMIIFQMDASQFLEKDVPGLLNWGGGGCREICMSKDREIICNFRNTLRKSRSGACSWKEAHLKLNQAGGNDKTEEVRIWL